MLPYQQQYNEMCCSGPLCRNVCLGGVSVCQCVYENGWQWVRGWCGAGHCTLYTRCTCTPGTLRLRQTGLLFSKWHSLKLQQRGWRGCSLCLDVNQSCDVRCDVQLSVSWPGPVLWPAWCAVWRCCNNIRPVSVRPQSHTHHHHALSLLCPGHHNISLIMSPGTCSYTAVICMWTIGILISSYGNKPLCTFGLTNAKHSANSDWYSPLFQRIVFHLNHNTLGLCSV